MNVETDVDQICYAWARGDPLKVITFCWSFGIRIPDHFFYLSHHCGIEDSIEASVGAY